MLDPQPLAARPAWVRREIPRFFPKEHSWAQMLAGHTRGGCMAPTPSFPLPGLGSAGPCLGQGIIGELSPFPRPFQTQTTAAAGQVGGGFFSNFYFKSHNWSLTKSDPVIGARAGGGHGARGALPLPPPAPAPFPQELPSPGLATTDQKQP